jgi:hypothetical protein
MKILKVIRDDKFVQFRHEVGGHESVEDRDIIAHEAPLKSFDLCLQALVAVVCAVLQLPSDYATGMTVRSLTVSHTKRGTRSVAIKAIKGLDTTGRNHPITTPLFQIDDGAEGEDGRMECQQAHAELVDAMIYEVEQYANGDRQQALLPFRDESEPAVERGDVLKFETPAPEPKPEKKAPAKKAAGKKRLAKA